MNILLVNHYAGSPAYGMEYRPYYIAREWVRAGHTVTIVAASQSHIRATQPQFEALQHEEIIDGIRYVWFKTPAYSGNGVGRILNMAAFVARMFWEAKRLARRFKPNVVIESSTYTMDIWPAHRIAKLAGAKLVYEVHDLWPLSPMELGNISKWHPFILVVQAAENYAYRHSDVVVSMPPKVHDHMRSHGLKLAKLHVIPNGVDAEEWREPFPELDSRLARELEGIRASGQTIVGYAGTHGISNALDVFLDSAELLQDESICFVLVGSGPHKAAVQKRAEGLKNVRFFDPIKKSQVPALLRSFDIAYIGWHRQPLYRFGISPNKLMDYMMSGRAVLHSVEAGNDPVHEARCGLTVPPEDPRAVADGIRQLVAAGAGERHAMGARGRDFILANHTYAVLAHRFLEALHGGGR